MARQQLFSPFQSYVAGREARQSQDYAQTRNKLAELELADAPAQMQRRNALADVQLQGAQVGLQSAQQQLSAEQAKFAYAKLKQAVDSGNPKAFITQQIPELAAKLQQQGIDIASMDDQSVAQLTDQMARKYAGEAGIAGEDPRLALERERLEQGQTQFKQRLALDRDRLNYERSKPQQSKDERLVQIADANGNPIWVRESDAVNKPAYVARDKPAAADLKYQREIKAKVPRLNAALRRMDRVEAAVAKIADNRLFDGGEADQFVINRTEEGRELIAAAAQLLPELTALTRVPGIGSQSDLETRLQNLQFPSSEFPPEVNRRNAAELRAFLQDLKDAYTGAETEIQSAEVSSLLDKYAPK